jgi:hypothetical protein
MPSIITPTCPASYLSRPPWAWIPISVNDIKALQCEAARQWSLARRMGGEIGRLGVAAA